MQHSESTVKVYQTVDYARFKMILGNRQLNDAKIKKIIKEIERGNDMLKYAPIQVRENNNRLDILDGQHRFFISRKLKRPVHYILIDEEKTIPDIAKINSAVEKWKAGDFINCYVQQGNAHYIALQKFMDDFDFSVSVSIKLLQYGYPGSEGHDKDISQKFQYGEFEVKHLEDAEALANQVLFFDKFEHCRQRAFIIAIYRIQKAGLINLIDLFNAYTKKPEMLTSQHSYKEYIYNLESIYNFGKQKRTVVV